MNRRKFLEVTGASAVTTSLLAGCSAISTSQKPTYSYEAITGVWTGDVIGDAWGKVEFSKQHAERGEEIGTAQELQSKGGATLCRIRMLVHHSDPPTYWTDVKEEESTCSVERLRFLHKQENGELLWFLRKPDEISYTLLGTLERMSD